MKIDKMEKLFTAIEVMSKPNGVSISDLQEVLKCDRKTVYRLTNDLDVLGIPYEKAPDVDGRTNSKRLKINPKYLERYSGVLVRLNPGERFLLTYVLKRSEILLDSSLSDMMSSLLEKLDRILIFDTANDTQVVTIHNKSYRIHNGVSHELFRTFIDAIQNRTPLEATYHAMYDRRHTESSTPAVRREKKFILHPYSLLEYNGAYYISGKSDQHDAPRIFLLERFSRAVVVKDAASFTIPADYDPDKLLESRFSICDDEQTIRPKLHFSSWAKNSVYNRKWGDDQKIEVLDDGTCVLTFTTRGRDELNSWILSFGSGVKVLEPQELRDDIIGYLQDALSQYQQLSQKPAGIRADSAVQRGTQCRSTFRL